MSGYVVEVEFHDLDQDKLTELHGPFRTQRAADTFRDKLGRAAGLEQQSYGWTGNDGDCRFVTVASRPLQPPRVRERARGIKTYLTENREDHQ